MWSSMKRLYKRGVFMGASRHKQQQTAHDASTYLLRPEITVEECFAEDDRFTLTKAGNVVAVVALHTGEASLGSLEQVEQANRIKHHFLSHLDPNQSVRIVTTKWRQTKKANAAPTGVSRIDAMIERMDTAQANTFFEQRSYVIFETRAVQPIRKTVHLVTPKIEQQLGTLRSQIGQFRSYVNRVVKLLETYQPEILRGKELQDFWVGYYNGGVRLSQQPHHTNLARIIAHHDWQFDPHQKVLSLLGPNQKMRYAAVLGLRELPDETHTEILQQLHRLSVEFEIHYWLRPLDPEEHKHIIASRMQSVNSTEGFNQAQLQELDEAGHQVAFNKLQLMDYHFMVTVFADDAKSLERDVDSVFGALALCGVTPIREGWNLQASFFGRQPDCESYLSPRKVTVSLDNVSHLIQFASQTSGHATSAFGDHPIANLPQRDATPYQFHFHPDTGVATSGHTALFAPPGSGKSTFVMYCLHRCLAYPKFKALIFDAGKGVHIPTLMADGAYNTIGDGARNAVHMNPLAALNDNEANREFLGRWLARLAGGVSDEEANALNAIVAMNYDLAVEDRGFKHLESLFIQGSSGNARLKEALAKWLPGDQQAHPYSRYFNAKKDDLDFNARLVAFDMDSILATHADSEDDVLLGAISSYIFHSFKMQMDDDPAPHVIFVDEARAYIEDPLFGKYIVDLAQKQRKKLGVLVLAGQDPSIVVEHDTQAPYYNLKKQILQNIETFLIWPNANAKWEDYGEQGIGLNAREFDWVKAANTKQRQLMLKQKRSGFSTVLDISLKNLDHLLGMYDSTSVAVRQAQELQRQDYESWCDNYLNQNHKS